MSSTEEKRFPFPEVDSELFHLGCTLVKTLLDAGYSAYIVGGAVRDMVMGRIPHDLDITTSATPEEVEKLFEHTVPVGAAFGVMLVILQGIEFEVATYREERDYEDGRRPETLRFSKTVQEDVARRDFTVNALLYDVARCEIVDLTGGVEDLHKGVLRTIGNARERFSEDYLRMLRAVRFTVRFGFEMDPELREAIRSLAQKTRFLSRERIRDELNKMLCGPHPEKAVELLSDTGLLEVILPDVQAMKGVEQDARFHPEGDVFVHTMLMLSHIRIPSVELCWAVLLHDVGKKECRTEDPDGCSHFYGHEDRGADMTEEILRDFKHPADVIKRVTQAVRYHMRFASVQKMREAKLRRLIVDSNFLLELELHRLDCISCHGFMDNYLYLIDKLALLRENREETLPKALLNGHDLIRRGVPPGRRIGQLLRLLADMQLEGLIRTRSEAFRALDQLLSEKH